MTLPSQTSYHRVLCEEKKKKVLFYSYSCDYDHNTLPTTVCRMYGFLFLFITLV